MILDASTRRNLELTETLRGDSPRGSLLGVLDQTVTPMGSRLMRQWVNKPLLDLSAIIDRQECVDYLFKQGLLRADLRIKLKPLADIERLTNRILANHALPRDLVALRQTLEHLPEIRSVVPQGDNPISQLLEDFALCEEELSLLRAAIAEDPPATLQNIGVIRDGYSTELDGILERSRHARQWIANLEAVERNRTGIKSLKVGYNKVFGYYIEVTHANAEIVPEEYIRKQTLVNAERYITPELKEYETLVLNAEETIREVENRLFKEVDLCFVYQVSHHNTLFG
jgi:DNA mismatch repair protein MutS